MNSVTFKVIRRGFDLYPVGWRGTWHPLRRKMCHRFTGHILPSLFRWPGLYKVNLRVDTEWGLFIVQFPHGRPLSDVVVWHKGRWVACGNFCVPKMRQLPTSVPFYVETEWLRKATKAEPARWC